MHVEVQVALNFLISFLFNKLPRRRVAQFGEELEATLKAKFAGHWYPEAPSKGSAYRCIRCAPPLEREVFEVAAYQAGMSLVDIEETLPHELTIWVDPGEVSYRLREGCPVKLLYSTRNGGGGALNGNGNSVEPLTTTLNPEAQCFRPSIVEQQQQQQQHNQQQQQQHLPLSNHHHQHHHLQSSHHSHQNGSSSSFLPSPGVSPSTPLPSLNYPVSGATAVLPSPALTKSGHHQHAQQQHPVTFTTAAFAATKFGSTKLKTNGGGGKKSGTSTSSGSSSSGNGLSNGSINGSGGLSSSSSLVHLGRNGSPTDLGLFGTNHGKLQHHQQQQLQQHPKSLNGTSILGGGGGGGHNWSAVANGNHGMINHQQQQQQNSHRQLPHLQQQQTLHHLRNGGGGNFGGNSNSVNGNNFFSANSNSSSPPQQQQQQQHHHHHQNSLLNGQTTALDLLDFADLEGCWKIGLSNNSSNGSNNMNNNNSLLSPTIYQQHSQQSIPFPEQTANIWASSNSGGGSGGGLMNGGCKKMSDSLNDFGGNLSNGGNAFENLFGDPFEQSVKSLSFNQGHQQQQQQQQNQFGLLDNTQLALLSERLWDEIFSISPEETNGTMAEGSAVNGLANIINGKSGDHNLVLGGGGGGGGGPTAHTNGAESEVVPLFCSSASSSFSLSSMSSPSLSTTSNESNSASPPQSQQLQQQQQQQQQQLVTEFDSLSLNSNNSSTSSSSSASSSSSVGSSVSYIN